VDVARKQFYSDDNFLRSSDCQSNAYVSNRTAAINVILYNCFGCRQCAMAAATIALQRYMGCHMKKLYCRAVSGRRSLATSASGLTTSAAAVHGAPHPVTYHPDFQIQPIDEGHRFPMPKDHLLYLVCSSTCAVCKTHQHYHHHHHQ